MRVAVELEPDGAEAVRLLREWRTAWSASTVDEGIELVANDSLAALLDLQKRCYDRGLTVNVVFPDNL